MGVTDNDPQSSPAADLASGGTDQHSAGPAHDEAYCVECGEIIKKQAEICPECGVRQQPVQSSPEPEAPSNDDGGVPALTDRRQYELEEIAANDKTTVVLVGFLLTPLAYWMLDKKALAAINFFTFNYFLLGLVVVPIHCYVMIENAEQELRKAGVSGY